MTSEVNKDETTSTAATPAPNYGTVAAPDKMYLDEFYEKIGTELYVHCVYKLNGVLL